MTNAAARDLVKKNDKKTTSNIFSKEFQKPRVISLDKMLTDQGLFPAIENNFGNIPNYSNSGLNLQVLILE